MPTHAWTLRSSKSSDTPWIERLLQQHWGGRFTIMNEQSIDLLEHPALIAGDRQGIAIYRIAPRADLLLLHADRKGDGIGTALVERVLQICFEGDARELCVTTTNDNVRAIEFYQRLGFHIAQVREGAVERARLRKPQIPVVGNDGIPIRDEIELVIKREGASRRPP